MFIDVGINQDSDSHISARKQRGDYLKVIRIAEPNDCNKRFVPFLLLLSSKYRSSSDPTVRQRRKPLKLPKTSNYIRNRDHLRNSMHSHSERMHLDEPRE